MDVEQPNSNPNPDVKQPLKKKRSPYRLLVDAAQNDDQNENSIIGLNADKITELGFFKGDIVSIKVIRLAEA